MRFDKIIPCPALRPYVKHLVISEQESANTYKVFPSTGLVIGFQYRGKLSVLKGTGSVPLDSTGITGIQDRVSVFKNEPHIGTILVFFTETGMSHFSATPANELFNQSISLEHVFDRARLTETEDKLTVAGSDAARIKVVENFLLSQMKEKQEDKLIMEAVRLIYAAKGSVRISTLHSTLFISASPFEKRFRKLVGVTPKKFASIVRFNTVMDNLKPGKSLTEICYEHNFFDQAHFVHDFKKFTGETPGSI